eukprot:SAG31_NODE_574_length_13967_cov_7.512042_12_plen_139_part_00
MIKRHVDNSTTTSAHLHMSRSCAWNHPVASCEGRWLRVAHPPNACPFCDHCGLDPAVQGWVLETKHLLLWMRKFERSALKARLRDRDGTGWAKAILVCTREKAKSSDQGDVYSGDELHSRWKAIRTTATMIRGELEPD